MTYSVYKKGIGAIYGARKQERVATGLTWQQAHDKVMALSQTTSNYYFFISY